MANMQAVGLLVLLVSPSFAFRVFEVPIQEDLVARNSTEMPLRQSSSAANKKFDIGAMLKELEAKLAEVKLMGSRDFKVEEKEDPIANDLAEEIMREAVEVVEQKDRELRATNLEHSFTLHDGEEVRRGQVQYQGKNQDTNNRGGDTYSEVGDTYSEGGDTHGRGGDFRGRGGDFYSGNGGSGHYWPQEHQPRSSLHQGHYTTGQQEGTGQDLTNSFRADSTSAEQQLTETPAKQSRQAVEAGTEEDLRCINKVMQVETVVYEDKVKCQHTFTEKCHDTFITDYIPTQERKCDTSFEKKCHITYKPKVFDESVRICDEGLRKVCDNTTIGQGEEVCRTHYETTCETRFKEHEIEQDEPVCQMVTERRCRDVKVPVPNSVESFDGGLEGAMRIRRMAQEGGPGATLEDTESDTDLLSIGTDCEDWPVQKCTLERKVVKKVSPDTSCRKVPKDICAPSNCVFKNSDKMCRNENRQLVQNIPSEQCDLEPREDCKMETVLVPRLVQQPNCIKVPKEICINVKSNPRKVTKPVVKEWCYKPSDLKSPSTRLALSQFFSN